MKNQIKTDSRLIDLFIHHCEHENEHVPHSSSVYTVHNRTHSVYWSVLLRTLSSQKSLFSLKKALRSL
jgi:hypothetical protein